MTPRKRMLAFYRAYPENSAFGPQAVAQTVAGSVSPQPLAKTEAALSLLWQVPWGHHVLLLNKVKAPELRAWYTAGGAIGSPITDSRTRNSTPGF